jgi:parallel beta-helix repeat protein
VTIKGVQNVPEASFPLAMPNIKINASGVKIHDFIIEGPDYASGYYSSGIVIGASDVEIFNNTFKVTPATTLGEISQAIQTYHKSAQPGVDISGLNIHDNVFSNLSSGEAGYEGIYINVDEGVGVLTVQNNRFMGGVVRAVTTESSNTSIIGNTVMTDLPRGLPGGYQGINIGGANDGNVTDVSVAGNVVNGSTSGAGFLYGVKLGFTTSSTFANIDITGNTIEMNEVGVWVRFSAGGITIRSNNIVGNTNYGVENSDTTRTVDAEYNWWGNETGPYHPTLNPTGLGDTASDYVDFTPWLIQPYPLGVPIGMLHVEPSTVEFWTPAYGSSFDVQVEISNITLLYGFQFNLTWDGALLSLDSAVYYAPWTSYYEVKETLASDHYLLALSATSPALPFNGSSTLAALTFNVAHDPLYPDNATCELKLENVTMGDPDGYSIPHLVYSGSYSCYSTKPEILLSPPEYTAYKVPTEFGVAINVTNVVDLEELEVELTFNSTLLNVIDVGIAPFFTGSYVTEWEVNNTLGTVFINIKDIVPYANGSGSIATLTFQVIYSIVWNAEKTSINSTLNFNSTKLLAAGDVPIDHDAVNGTYYYVPVEGDLNRDGTVELTDLVIAGQAFGSDPAPPYDIVDLNSDGAIDILDIIVIARNYGRTG